MKIVWAGSRHAFEISDRISKLVANDPWWPDGLGKVSTHGVVYARLIIDGQEHGIHGFIVQLPSLEDHKPLPGITVGDIGMKFGNRANNTMDNGVLRFDHVCIPRDQMLMSITNCGACQVYYVFSNQRNKRTPDDKLSWTDSLAPAHCWNLNVVSPLSPLVYETLVFVRQKIVQDASCALSKAVCIATRYSAVRRQFGSQNGGPETQVIDYKTQQSRLFPLLASAYAFRFVGEWLNCLYADVTQRLQANDFSTLPEIQSCTAGLKSLTTSVTADGKEECRKLCGGHGYLCSSGLPELFAVYVPACMYEGDNIVPLLQEKFTFRNSNIGLRTVSPLRTMAYLGRIEHRMQYRCNVEKAEDWLNPGAVLEAFEARAARMSISCAQKLSKFSNPEEGFAELSADLVEAAIAHWGVKQQLKLLCGIYSLFLLHKHQGDNLATSCITPKQASLANDQLRELYSQARPNAIALVDAFNYTDHFLGSILGSYDGNVYPKLYEAAWKDALNESVVPDGYHQYIRPLLKQ
ncbi:hypothetical protein ACH5RR_038721 [Cinchona calisaya]|uniref:Acyl-coenzyme A oxidase n=1 Tax=Cinchona calisaya TaxID=153742 RepID=A0ABD2XXH3_9GENT